MSTLLRASWVLFETHLTRLVRSRRALLCLALALVPALLAWLISSLSERPTPGGLAALLGWLVLLQVIVPLSALVAGSAVVAEEVDDRTITYLFTRPLPRPALLLGRLAATLLVLTLALALGTLLLLAAAERARGRGPGLDDAIREPLFLAVLAGGAVYAAIFAALGAFVRHPMIVGLAYAFVIEGFLANLPGRSQALTVQHHLRSLIAEGGSRAFERVEGFAAASYDTPAEAWSVLAAIFAAALLLGCWRLARRQFVLTA